MKTRALASVLFATALLAGCAKGDAQTQENPVTAAPVVSPPPSPAPVASPSPTPSAAGFANGVSVVECDPDARQRPDSVFMLGPGSYRLSGWSHVTGVGSFESVKLPIGEYKIGPENLSKDDRCGGQNTYKTVLAKKTGDWDKNHANGLEGNLSQAIQFEQIDYVAVEFFYEPERSYIPSAAELAEAYGHLLSAEELALLDNQKITLELTLYGESASSEFPFFNASAMIDVDPAEAANTWVRVQIPVEDLTFYTEENYARLTDGDMEALKVLDVAGIRINPETSERLTLRHLIPDTFSPGAQPELFKEMALTFSLIEVGLR